MKFNPEEYETVKSRKARFYKDHEDGRIVVELLNPETAMDHAIFKASVYVTSEDQRNLCPRGVGYALEVRDRELSVSTRGEQYESVNYSSWTENCEESAVGRALDNAGYSGNKKPSRDEMEKASRMNTTMKTYNTNQAIKDLRIGFDMDKWEFKGQKCTKCGANLIPNQDLKPYCANKCWLPENKHLQDAYKPQATEVINKLQSL